MKIRQATILSALALLAISCEKDPDAGSVWEDPKFVRVVAPTEMVRSGSTELEIFYMENQQIKVWERDGNAVNLKVNKDNDSVFFSYDWIPDAVPVYAAFPSTEETSCKDGIFEIKAGTEQKVSVPGKIETFVAVGSVTGANRQSYNVSPLRNITGFVELGFTLPFIESIILEAPGGEPLAGSVSVDCGKLEKGEDAWFTVIDGSPSVTVSPAEAGGFIEAGAYYVSVLPGYYSKGLKITVNYKNGLPLEKTYGETTGLTVSRSAVLEVDVNPMDSDLIAKLPDDIRIDLDFSRGWPFVEQTVPAARQEETGYAEDTYTYVYRFKREGAEEEFAVPLLLKGNKTAYLYENNTYKPGNAYSYVVLPALPEHYLRAVKLEVKNSSGKTYLMNDYKTGARLLEWDVAATKESPSILSFPTEGGIAPYMATPYKMSFKEGGAVITNISLLYSKELPSEYNDNPFGDKPQEPDLPGAPETDLPDEIRVDLDFVSWPFDEDIASNEAQMAADYKGNLYHYTLKYETDGEQKTKELTFFIKAQGGAYTHENKTFKPAGGSSRMTLPAIPGRYIRAVRMEVNNGSAKSFRLDNLKWTQLATSSGAVTGTPALLSFPTEDGVVSEFEAAYYMYFINGSTQVKKISILYSKELPSEYDDNPFGDKPQEPQEPDQPVAPETDLPDEMRLDLDFASWPFDVPIATDEVQAAADNKGNLYPYTLKYEADGEQKTKELSFFIKTISGGTYTHTNGTFRPAGTGSRMTLPAISGRYIRAVRMEVNNGSAKSFRLDNMEWKPLATSSGAVTGTPALLSFPTEDGVVSEFEAAYYMYFINGSTQVKKISILYSKELPSEYDDNPFAE